MRRWICVLVLLFGFAGQGYAVTGRLPAPVPIERPITVARGGRLQRTAWWQTS